MIEEMKTVFIWGAIAALGLSGCIDLEAPPQGDDSSGAAADDDAEAGDEQSDDDGPDSGPTSATVTAGDDDADSTTGDCTDCTHELSGELMMFVNGRLTSAEGLYQVNAPLGEPGTYVGSAIYLYDPNLECDDGGTACRLAHVGNLRLDESLGIESVQDESLKKFSLRDIAWSPTHGLWGASFDVLNDEWGLVRIDVPDWHGIGQQLPLERWNILPGDPASPSTDGCYWQESVSGLGFFGDELLLGVRGLGGVGISNDGMVFRVQLDVMVDQGWCVYENDPSQDPHYYACDVLCRPYADFGPALGIAGDLESSPRKDHAIGIVRGEDEAVMPFDRAELYRIDPPAGTDPSSPAPLGLYVDGIEIGHDIEGLARVDGVLYGIDVLARVWKLDDVGNSVTMHDDLSVHFEAPEQALKIRGATTVVVDSP